MSMTKTDKSIQRETYTSVRACRSMRPLVIELRSTYLVIRAKGCPSVRYTVTYDQVFTVGARNKAEETRKERIAKRKAAHAILH